MTRIHHDINLCNDLALFEIMRGSILILHHPREEVVQFLAG